MSILLSSTDKCDWFTCKTAVFLTHRTIVDCVVHFDGLPMLHLRQTAPVNWHSWNSFQIEINIFETLDPFQLFFECVKPILCQTYFDFGKCKTFLSRRIISRQPKMSANSVSMWFCFDWFRFTHDEFRNEIQQNANVTCQLLISFFFFFLFFFVAETTKKNKNLNF